jgi:hypothetical protein
MTAEGTILLLESKLRAYKNGYSRALAEKDDAAAKKWIDGYKSTRKRIVELKGN